MFPIIVCEKKVSFIQRARYRIISDRIVKISHSVQLGSRNFMWNTETFTFTF